jgi:hypothetical protein
MKKLFLIFVVFQFVVFGFSQTVGQKLLIPDIEGFKTLKCDFHMHTIYSDGKVTPEERVNEAKREGIDAIAITDHLEFQLLRTFFGGDLNLPFNRALKTSRDSGVILIRGTEITRTMPPGHFNALFLTNINKLKRWRFLNAIHEARKQGAYIQWNHPAWKSQIHDSVRMYSVHKKMIEDNLLDAMEIVNDVDYYPIVFNWCLDYNKTIIGNSDVHKSTESEWRISAGGHRPMTIVFADSLTENSIKAALFAGRTVVWQRDNLYGKQEWLASLYYASVIVTDLKRNGEYFSLSLQNKSDIPFDLLCDYTTTTIRIPSRGNISLNVTLPEPMLTKQNFVNCTVKNCFINPEKNLVVKFPIVP